jgi:predicted Rossmann-fold nucleotide-binding protein
MNIILFDEIQYEGLKKVISGGQDGVDFAGLVAAHDCGYNTGGHCPRFCRTHSGSNLELTDIYGLNTVNSTDYKTRTRLNVQNSDGTVLICSNFNSPGCLLTVKYLEELKKPYIKITVPFMIGEERVAWQELIKWLHINKITTLNVAGNRDKNTRFGDHYHAAYFFLSGIFRELREKQNQNKITQNSS